MRHPQPDVIALGIQQPWAELILRGVKTIELRNVPTRLRQPIYLYASRTPSPLECAVAAAEREGLDIPALPRGLVVGMVEIVGCRPSSPDDANEANVPAEMTTGRFSWILHRPERCPAPLPPLHDPFGMWFYPFRLPTNSPRRRKRHGGA